MKHADRMVEILQMFIDSRLPQTSGVVSIEGLAKRAIEDYRNDVDPYAHLKEAQERGDVIQLKHGGWQDMLEPTDFPYDVDRYRIKPKENIESKIMHLAEKGGAWTGTIGGEDVTFVVHGEVTGIELFDRFLDDDEIRKAFKDKPKTKTLYLWAFRNKTGWRECQKFSEHQPSIFDAIEYKRLDYTAIEVEE